jgi:hypothetical protein
MEPKNLCFYEVPRKYLCWSETPLREPVFSTVGCGSKLEVLVALVLQKLQFGFLKGTKTLCVGCLLGKYLGPVRRPVY